MVIRNHQVLLGKRLNTHGAHSWSFPGGNLEFGEDILECAKREVMEETGLIITNPQIATFTNDIFHSENKHYITIHVLCHSDQGEPQVLEPTKCQTWQWFDWNNLPQPLFLPLQNLLKQNYNPFENSK